ncbi:MAG: class I SAM-dependent methyltransferase [Solirubrobacterales bacterium]|nr:class I SAM-dependent methyltransferase [Solirubrobacterales bacterium]MBV9364226.1 class I SAM-dependent methyltransferase [Solirubrobacterales bacterium]MBV9680488.1 class I SAM-dependent methyltransferase [Solirubrobacterales bacterium]MBV9808854.1 class I SAM-dependent methyltransferase [Solirubrobacterales bacterium]
MRARGENGVVGSCPYRTDNVLDRLTSPATLDVHYQRLAAQEQQLLARRVPLTRGDVLSVGCGATAERHLFPAPSFRLTAVDANPAAIRAVVEAGRADDAFVGHAGRLDLPNRSFDIVLYRLVLHHIAYQGPLAPCFAEAARLLRPGGALIAVEPGLWHPVGIGLSLANRLGLATAIHGTPDDIPLSPRRLTAEAAAAGLVPELHALTYSWRRLPAWLQRLVQRLDVIGSRPRSAPFGHTLALIARRNSL